MSTPAAVRPTQARLLRRWWRAWTRPRHGRLEPADKTYLNAELMRLMVVARAVMVAGALAMAFAMELHSGVALPVAETIMVVLALAALSAAGLAGVRRGSNTTESELLMQLMCDIVILTAVLAAAAGRKSPFELLFVLPVMVGAYAFTGWRMALVAATVAAGWTTLHQLEGTVPAYPMALEMPAHVAVGTLLAYYAYAMARLARRQQRIMAGHRERAINALGAEATTRVATDAAHTLGTPLGTMAVIVADLQQARIPPAERAAALDTLAEQIGVCKLHLCGLLRATGAAPGEHGYRAGILHVLAEMRAECLLFYPAGRVEISHPAMVACAPDVVIELGLFNALAGVLKDLVREAPHAAHVAAAWDEKGVVLSFRPGHATARQAAPNPRRRERLAVLEAIVQRHGGSMRLNSSGDAITLRLPGADQPLASHY